MVALLPGLVASGAGSALRGQRVRPRRSGCALARDAARPPRADVRRPDARHRRGVRGRRPGRARGRGPPGAVPRRRGGRGGRALGRDDGAGGRPVRAVVVERPYAAALREARDQPAPPAAMAGYSAVLADDDDRRPACSTPSSPGEGAATAARAARLRVRARGRAALRLIARRWADDSDPYPGAGHGRGRARRADPTHRSRRRVPMRPRRRVTVTVGHARGSRPTDDAGAGRDHGSSGELPWPRRPVGRARRERAGSVRGATARGGSRAPTRVMGRHGTTHAVERGAAPAPIGATGTTARDPPDRPGAVAAMTTICDLDPVVAGALSSSVGGSPPW